MARVFEAGIVTPTAHKKLQRTMQVNVLLFAAARQAAGSDSIRIELPNDARVSDVFAELKVRLPAIEPLIPSCRIALDSAYVDTDATICEDNEIALIPPVSGG